MSVPAPLRALANRDFRLFWLGQLVSLIGTWMQSVGQAWLVLQLTSSAFLLGLLTALQFTPMLCFAIFAGAFADRLPKRRLLLTTQSLLGVQALTLSILVWTGHVRYWHVAILATLHAAQEHLEVTPRWLLAGIGVGGVMAAVLPVGHGVLRLSLPIAAAAWLCVVVATPGWWRTVARMVFSAAVALGVARGVLETRRVVDVLQEKHATASGAEAGTQPGSPASR